MATIYAQSPTALNPVRQQFFSPNSPPVRRQVTRQRFVTEFSQCLIDFVVQMLPAPEELAIKEDVRKLLERLIRTIEPDSRLLSFGSTANGFSLKNSDMDLCCLIDSEDRLAATDMVTMLGDLLERETKFHVKPLPHARIPIVKLSLDPSPGLPFGIACDIGFENRLALENTRLLMCYAMIDPNRVRTMVLFLKVWSKRRKINSPYKGTLSSYGYVLLVIYFLVHVKNPPVLPNLQQMPPLRPISDEETHLNGYNIWFFDDIELLRQRWKSSNTDTVADLLIDFFKYYSRDFAYNTGVASIRAGLLKKESKGWQNEFDRGTLRERNRLCIEDPFEMDFNVARCVTKDGLYTIRGEFMRASRILQFRPERAFVALAALCEERKTEELLLASPARATFAPPRLPPQTPYTVGSSPMRLNEVPVPVSIIPPEPATSSEESSPADRHAPGLSSLSEEATPSSPTPVPRLAPQTQLPIDQLEHMAPKRGKWTSPPPPEAPEEDRSAFEDRLGQSLALATASRSPWVPRQHEGHGYASSNSEVQTDDDVPSDLAESDDVQSVRSFTEEGAIYRHRERQMTATPENEQQAQTQPLIVDLSKPLTASAARFVPLGVHVSAQGHGGGGLDAKMLARLRGRPPSKVAQQTNQANAVNFDARDTEEEFDPPPRADTPRRSMSGPARTSNSRFSQLALPTLVPTFPGPRGYPSAQMSSPTAFAQNANVFYETTPTKDRMFRAMSGYAIPIPLGTPYNLHDLSASLPHPYAIPGPSTSGSRSPSSTTSSPRQPNISPRHLPASLRRSSKLAEGGPDREPSVLDNAIPLTASRSLVQMQAHAYQPAAVSPMGSPHSHPYTPSPSPSLSRTSSHSPIIPTRLQSFAQQHTSHQQQSPRSHARAHAHVHMHSHQSYSHSHPHSHPHPYSHSPQPASPFASPSSGSSPPMSCTSSQYAASSSPLSTSPPSPTHSDLVPSKLDPGSAKTPVRSQHASFAEYEVEGPSTQSDNAPGSNISQTDESQEPLPDEREVPTQISAVRS